MDQWLYVYGNGDFIYTILTSVNFFMNNAMSFFKVATVLSLLFFAISVTGILPTQGYDWARFIRVYVLVNVFVLMPYPGKTTVHDVLTNKDYVFNFNGSKLPFGLIFPVATISTLSYKLINLYQKNFSIDSNLNYSYSGMNFGANFIQGLDNVHSYDDKFNRNLDNYMQNCGFPLLYKQGKLADLRKSTNIFATLAANTSASRFVQQVNFTTGAPVVKACNVAIANIEEYYNTNENIFLAANAQMIGVGAGDAFTRYMNAANVAATRDIARCCWCIKASYSYEYDYGIA